MSRQEVDEYQSRLCLTPDFGAHSDVSSHSATNKLLQLDA